MKLRFSKKVWIALGVVVLLGAAAGIGFLLQQLQHKSDTPSTSNTQQALPASVSKVEELITAGKTEEAQQQITSALNNSSTSNEDKFLLYYSQANIASDKQDYNGVVDALLKANAIKETSDVDARLANAYQQLGDKAKAIDYYKKAIQHETDDNPMRDRETETYQQMIRDLGGQP
jgi:tetratricopeptide (TPR) repeat protein